MTHRNLKWLLSLFLTLSGFMSVAQEWKEVYNNALKFYEDQQYDKAMPLASQAYSLSKTLDQKNQAYTLQLITSICLESNRNDEGLNYIVEEENLFRKIEGETSQTYAESLRKHSLLLLQKGSYEPSLEKCREAIAVLKKSNQASSLAYGNLLVQEGQLEALLGKLSEAKASLDPGLKVLAANPEAGDDYLNALIISAGVDKKLKDLPSAEKKYRQAMGILEKNGMQESPAYGEASAALSEILLAKGNTTESANTIQHSSVAADQKAAQLLRIAVGYHNKQELEKALESYKAAEAAEIEGNLVNNTAFSIHLNFGKALLEVNNLPDASLQLDKASALCQKLYSPGASEYVLVDFARADLNLAQRNINAAADLYLKAGSNSANLTPAVRKQLSLRTAAQLLNEYQYETAVKFLTAMGADKVDAQSVRDQPELIIIYSQALLRSGQFNASRNILQSALKFPVNESIRLNLELALVQVLERKGDLALAMTLLSSMQKRQTSSPGMKLEITYQSARISQLMGHYQDAEKGYRIVLSSLQAKKDYSSQLLIQAYNSLAVLQTQLGNYEEAERLYGDLLKNVSLPADFKLTIRENLATIYEESLQLEKAKALLEEVARQERLLGEHNPDLAITLQNLATIYLKTGDLASAKKLLEEAIKIDRETIGDQDASFATKIANLGVVEQQLGNLDQSKKLFQQALGIHEKTLGREHPDYMYNAYNLAVAMQQSNDIKSAAPLFKSVSGFYRKEIQELFPAMSEKEKAAYYNKINEIILAYLDFCLSNYTRFPELKGELYDFRLTTKALLFNASSRIRNTILSSGDTLLLARFTEWQKTKEELGKLTQLDSQEKIQAESRIQGLRQRANELEKFLSEKSSSFFNETQQSAVDWKKVKAFLKKGQAAVEMIRLRLNLKNDSVIYAALILRPEYELPEIVIFPQGRKMESRDFYYYRNTIKFQIHNNYSYTTFWKPLEEKLKDVQTVYFSPDGIYNKINLMTLFDNSSGKYLLDKVKIKLVNNCRELLNSPKVKVAGQNAALFGRPDFDPGPTGNVNSAISRSPSDLESLVLNGIADLPGTEEEVDKIDSLLKKQKWETHIYLGPLNTETSVKQLKNTQLLHIATHGFFIPAEEDSDPVILSPDFRQPEKNPLLRSGLIFSGAQKSVQVDRSKRNFSEDGILTAYEVMNLNLDNTDLVILSACETGAGEIRNGEGIYGLQRAFLLAGSGNLVMSLWKVDDEATRELMVEFYRQWSTTEDKYEALYSTMNRMKAKWVEPYYWGGFAMIGAN